MRTVNRFRGILVLIWWFGERQSQPLYTFYAHHMLEDCMVSWIFASLQKRSLQEHVDLCSDGSACCLGRIEVEPELLPLFRCGGLTPSFAFGFWALFDPFRLLFFWFLMSWYFRIILLLKGWLPLFLPSLSHFLFSLSLSLSRYFLLSYFLISCVIFFLVFVFLALFLCFGFMQRTTSSYYIWKVVLINCFFVVCFFCFFNSLVIFTFSFGPTSPNPALRWCFVFLSCSFCVGFVFVVFALFLFA